MSNDLTSSQLSHLDVFMLIEEILEHNIEQRRVIVRIEEEDGVCLRSLRRISQGTRHTPHF